MNAYAAAPWTRASCASILTSRLPIETGIFSEGKEQGLHENFFTIQEFFNDRGYKTATFYANPHIHLGLNQNFGYKHYKVEHHAHKIYALVKDWLSSNLSETDKFFLYIHHNDPHEPFWYHEGFNFTLKNSTLKKPNPFFNMECNPDKKNVTAPTTEELAELQANYDGEIRYVDHHIGEFVAYLEEHNLMNNTIIIITADHGEEFFDHGGFWHGCTLYEELLKVPLLIYLPHAPPQTFDEKVGLIDIFPTVVDVFERDGIATYDFSGQSLLPLIESGEWEEKPLISVTGFRDSKKYSLILGDMKIIYRPGWKNDTLDIFNLTQDAFEQNDLAEQDPASSQEFLEILTSYIDYLEQRQREILAENESFTDEVDDETLEHLKSLGYLQ